jgi:hypothetical protein
MNPVASVNIATVGVTAVSTLTTLIDWTDLSLYESVVASLENQDASTAATLIVEFSQFATYADADTAASLSVGAQDEGSYEFRDTARRYVRLSAESSGTVNVRAALRGYHRMR